jgi:alcohol dehydrogenase (cytochrome c)
VLLTFPAALATYQAEQNPESTPASPAKKEPLPPATGQRSFESHCASCHGLDGRGGEHAHAIATPQAAGALDDPALVQIIRDGIPSQGMPYFGSLSEPEIHAIITYLRLLTGENPVRPGRGNSAQGERLFLGMDFVPQRLLVEPPAQDWPSYNGDYSGRRYSALDQINPDNVYRLRAQWVFHSTKSEALEVTPVVVGGVMYVTSANDAFALDARTGRVLWNH